MGLAGDQSRRKGPVAGESASSADPNEVSKRKSGPTGGSDQNIGDRGGSFEGKSGETEEEKLLRLGLTPGRRLYIGNQDHPSDLTTGPVFLSLNH